MKISLIAAIGKNNEIGKANTLLWNLPKDMEHFRTLTSGHPVIMGERTHDSIGRPLPNRTNIVVCERSREIEGCIVVNKLVAAIHRAQNTNSDEVFIIGGGSIYTQFIEQADVLYITHVDWTGDADVFFPPITNEWQKISEEKHAPDEKNALAYTFTTYKKKKD